MRKLVDVDFVNEIKLERGGIEQEEREPSRVGLKKEPGAVPCGIGCPTDIFDGAGACFQDPFQNPQQLVSYYHYSFESRRRTATKTRTGRTTRGLVVLYLVLGCVADLDWVDSALLLLWFGCHRQGNIPLVCAHSRSSKNFHLPRSYI